MTLRARLEARIGRRSIDVEIDTGGTLVVIGPNGAGKTSLLRLLLGERPVARGRVEVGDEVLLDTEKGIDVPLERRGLAYVPQDYALFPHLTVRSNVDFALASAGVIDRAARIDVVLRDLELAALADRRPNTLSGGEKQRVALARAISVRPRALLLDEPLAALDVHARRGVRDFLASYLKSVALPSLVVTHDPADARVLGAKIAVLEEGRVTQVGTWEELAEAPGSSFVTEFVSSAEPR
jgi:molybdate transport system ATP-binding protein